MRMRRSIRRMFPFAPSAVSELPNSGDCRRPHRSSGTQRRSRNYDSAGRDAGGREPVHHHHGTGDQTQYRIGEAPARDDWDQWNTDRDRMISGSVSRKHTNDYYVGSQISMTTAPGGRSGLWAGVVSERGGGLGSVPRGNWVWEPYWGWTWVSYEPWGWAPYHYGRWFEYNGAWGWWPGPDMVSVLSSVVGASLCLVLWIRRRVWRWLRMGVGRMVPDRTL